jgi:hypothetical protein
MYAVGELKILDELSKDEVEAAFWVGAKLGHSYLEPLCGAFLYLRKPAGSAITCKPFTCPTHLLYQSASNDWPSEPG